MDSQSDVFVKTNEVEALLQTAFPELTAVDLAALAQTAVWRTFAPNFDICRAGDIGETLYVIGCGEADILIHADDDMEILIQTIGAGTYFGEMSLLGNAPRAATIRTRSECTMLEISHASFEIVTNSNPGLLRRLLIQISNHLRRNDRAVIHALNVKNQELERTYADLAEQERLRTQFIATLSHELRTPLTTIRGYLDLINNGGLNTQTLPVAMGSITRNVERMVGLTNDMFLLYEMHPAEPTYALLDVPDLLVAALKMARERMGDVDTAVHFDIEPDVPQVYADRNTLLLAIRALLENAFKHTVTRAPVVVTVINTLDAVSIAITDQGVGIPEAEQARIFEPFYRLEKEGGSHLFPGIGVGLTIARFIVTRHNGRITVDSVPNEGSTFTIFLPHSLP